MFYKCPYCDMRVTTRLKPCPYCGAASSYFTEEYEDKDYQDKVNGKLVDTRALEKPVSDVAEALQAKQPQQKQTKNTYVQSVTQVLLLIMSFLAFCIPSIGFIIAIVVLCVSAHKDSHLRQGCGKTARIVAKVYLALFIAFLLIGITLYVAMTKY